MALQTSMNRRKQLAQLQRPAAGVLLQRLVVVEPVDRLLERVALDEPHGVVRPAVGVGAQAVDGDDAGVLEPAGDLGLGDEPLPADGVVGVLLEDLLERHLAVQLAVERHEDGAQAALGMRPEDAEPLAVGGGRADGIAAGAVGVIVVVGRAVRRADVPEGRLDVGAAGAREAFASRASDGQDGEALLGVAAQGLDVQAGDGLDGGAARGIEVAERRRGGRPAVGPCRESRRRRPRTAPPGRSGRSGGPAGRRAGRATGRSVGTWW